MVQESLTGQTALVTGASSGIGRATAEVLAREGASIAMAARREDRLAELASSIQSEYGVETLVLPTDVADVTQNTRMFESTVDELGPLNIVVSNAGVSYLQSIEEMEFDNFDAMQQVNVYGTFLTAQGAIPYLKETRGNLIFVGSFSGQYPNSAHPVYSATKWWTRGFALGLAGQIGGDEIGVTIVNPSEVRTELGGTGDRRPVKDRYEPGSITEPEDVAETIAFAAKQEPPNVVSELDLYRRDKFSGGTTPDTMK